MISKLEPCCKSHLAIATSWYDIVLHLRFSMRWVLDTITTWPPFESLRCEMQWRLSTPKAYLNLGWPDCLGFEE
jgi:hypothetical protein